MPHPFAVNERSQQVLDLMERWRKAVGEVTAPFEETGTFVPSNDPAINRAAEDKLHQLEHEFREQLAHFFHGT